MFDKLKEECGIFGISLKKPSDSIMHNMYMGLFSLQHRGQESSGVAYFDDNANIQVVKSNGLVAENLLPQLQLDYLAASAIGHVRYSTAGSVSLVNAQPLLFKCNKGEVAIAHNGQLPNYDVLKEELIANGAIFQTSSDSEILIHLMSNTPGNDFESSLISSIKKLDGAFSMLVMGDKNKIAAFKDPYGFRPLAYGKLEDKGYVFSSETAALDVLGATDINFLKPGELIICENGEIKQKFCYSDNKKASQCVFELIYFARPDSSVFSESVYQFRFNSGRMLAKNRKKDTDIVISVPDSGNIAALGFSRESGIPFDLGLMRNHYVGRTFIKTSQRQREEGVKLKLNPVKSVVEGKTISIVDDSIVRGTTSKKIIKMLREAGAKEIHMYLSSPEVLGCCYYGINTPTTEELISTSHTPEEIAKIIGADTVTFLQLEDLKSSLKAPDSFCYACFDKNYPIEKITK